MVTRRELKNIHVEIVRAARVITEDSRPTGSIVDRENLSNLVAQVVNNPNPLPGMEVFILIHNSSLPTLTDKTCHELD
jgi:hypothetical protein